MYKSSKNRRYRKIIITYLTSDNKFVKRVFRDCSKREALYVGSCYAHLYNWFFIDLSIILD